MIEPEGSVLRNRQEVIERLLADAAYYRDRLGNRKLANVLNARAYEIELEQRHDFDRAMYAYASGRGPKPDFVPSYRRLH